MSTKKHYISLLILIVSLSSHAQFPIDSVLSKIDPQRWSASVERRVSKIEDRLVAKSEKTLRRLQKQEEKIYQKQLLTRDSVEAKLQLADVQTRYRQLEAKIKDRAKRERKDDGVKMSRNSAAPLS